MKFPRIFLQRRIKFAFTNTDTASVRSVEATAIHFQAVSWILWEIFIEY